MTTSTSEATKAWVRDRAEALGFDACGFASATAPWDAGGRLDHFIDEGRHGTMGWLALTAARRAHPTAMWSEARTAVVLGINYGPAEDPLEALKRRSTAAISVYAQGRDYHDLIKGRLKTLAGQLGSRWGGKAKVFVDTAPLMEKPLAARAGLGWQGKHTNLVSRRHGSWLFLGSILTTLAIDPDAPEEDHCGACRACLEVCPTGAFPAPYQLDARRCLSYLTIEHAGPIPVAFRAAMGNRIYGCDDCLAVCPWNKFASAAHEGALHAREALKAPSLEALCDLDDAAFRTLFSASAVKRIGRDRFVRNVLYAIGNSGEAALAPAARRRLDDSCPVVREAAQWALRQLATDGEAAEARVDAWDLTDSG
jgi:epoxyqueuosine reductase